MRTALRCTILATALALTAALPTAATAAPTDRTSRPPVHAPATTASPTASLTPAQAAARRPALRQGARGPAVVYVQQVLKVRPTDGYYGPLTRAAVTAFQRKKHLSATGRVDARTWRAVLALPVPGSKPTAAKPALTPERAAAARPQLSLGMGPTPAVVFVQRFLKVTPTSGWFGPVTVSAVRAYQRGLGISATGVVGPLTWAAILAGKRPAKANSAAAVALKYALAQVGKRYVLGGNGPTVFDCSGLTQQAYLRVGITLPRLASQQRFVGTRVALSKIAPGDLLYYQNGPSPRGGHISMYAGNGKVVEAANPRRGVRIRSLNDSWYTKRFVMATRIG